MLTNDQIFKDRSNLYGGSDFPKIMGDSKFGSPWDIVLEKAGVVEREVKDNAYISFGNIAEPLIQEFMGTTNCDEKEFERNDYVLPLRCHIDGIRQEDAHAILIEIKASSGERDAVYNEYRSQIQTYMQATGLKKAELHLFQRVGKAKELFDKATEQMTSDWRMEYSSDKEKEEVEQKMLELLQAHKFTKSQIKVKKVKYDADYQIEIDDRVAILDKYIELIKNDPFVDLEALEQQFVYELNRGELMQYDTSKLIELENQIAEMKKIEAELKQEKANLLDFMLKNGIKKFDNDKVSITVKDSYERESIDTKKLKETQPQIYDQYKKKSKVKESISFKIKN